VQCNQLSLNYAVKWWVRCLPLKVVHSVEMLRIRTIVMDWVRNDKNLCTWISFVFIFILTNRNIAVELLCEHNVLQRQLFFFLFPLISFLLTVWCGIWTAAVSKFWNSTRFDAICVGLFVLNNFWVYLMSCVVSYQSSITLQKQDTKFLPKFLWNHQL